ncbi:MAG: hypothetical protein V3T86_02100 [Planctomycetota bacterium]
MAIATWLLFVMGLVGAADIALYHSVAHGIRTHEDSRTELFIHSLRGPTYFVLYLAVPNLALSGAWFVALVVLLAVDLAISLWDFAIEGDSRDALGGLPSGEYVLHIMLAMLFGGLVATVFLRHGQNFGEPTAISYEPADVPGLLRLALAVMAIVVLASGAQDLRSALRMRPARSAR